MLTLRKASGWLSFNRVSLKYRLLLYFLLLVILPTSIISVTIYNQSYRTITDNMTASVQKNLNMMETVLLKKFDDMDGVADAIYLNPDMIDMLSADRPADQVGFVNELASFNKILDGYAQPEGPGKRFVPKLYMLDRPEYVQYNFSRNVSTISEIEKEPWYAALPPKARYTVAGLQAKAGPGGTAYTIKLAKRLFGLKNMTIPYVGLLTIDADVADFNALLAQLKPSANSAVFILDERANVIVSPDPGLLGRSLADQPYVPELLKRGGGAGSFDEEIGGQAELVSYRKLADPGWTIVSVSPIRDLNGKLVAFRQAMYVVLAACMALAFFIALLLSNNIAKPIRKFVKTMSYAQDGNFDIQIQYKRKDEFTYLFSQYNKMIMQIKELINKLYVSEVKKKEAELKALQSQINPHFLYNTLDSINWIALRHDVPDISEMVTSLSDFFRYSLSKGRSVIPLEDELRQVGSYLAIHKFRFKDKLDYAIRVDPEVHGHYTVKLVLQPLVENAILHGIEKRHGKGRIDVVARKRGDRIEIEIADDGVGADPDALNARLDSGTGEDAAFGTINVHRRLKQTFGEQAGIRYRRREGPGLVVIATMPAVTTWEENEDAQDDHRG